MRNRDSAIMMSRAMVTKHFVAVFAAGSCAAMVTLVACSSSSGGGVAADAGADAPIEATTDVTDAPSNDDVQDAGACGNIATDGDPYTACLVQRCCFELMNCRKDCEDYKACAIACGQMDAGPACFDQCGMMHSNGQVQLHALDICGNNKCTTPAGDH